ncbi:uncharacterized protein LOC134182704 [Corticium candelabrum]|uniref:uncharacterized protein LOC134182704 n=1 Tax=Corticium candelabrum TaxID=121492 RepID=UPI002E266196|nr:uncharacterized protein LOC134182704 [Corticium candelabrum]
MSADYFKSYLTIQYYSTKQRDDVYNCTAINPVGSSTASTRVTVQEIDGWVESNRGSQCSLSCGSGYGITLVQRQCSIRRVRCLGPAVYTDKCRPQTTCPTYASTVASLTSLISTGNVNTSHNVRTTLQELGYTHDISTTQDVAGKQELSQSAVAGISVTVTAITTVLICVIIFYFVVHRRRQLSASNLTTSPDMQTEFPSRKSLHDDSRAEQNTVNWDAVFC